MSLIVLIVIMPGYIIKMEPGSAPMTTTKPLNPPDYLMYNQCEDTMICNGLVIRCKRKKRHEGVHHDWYDEED